MKHEQEYIQYKVGDDIYIGGMGYLSRGKDDFAGGLCKISKIEGGGFAVAEYPGHMLGFAYWLPKQEELKAVYGNKRGYADPDMRPEFNTGD